jgi:hypothetical protein
VQALQEKVLDLELVIEGILVSDGQTEERLGDIEDVLDIHLDRLKALEEWQDNVDVRVQRLEGFGPKPIRRSGVVKDAGGGEITILIDRDTMTYPAIGSRITLVAE